MIAPPIDLGVHHRPKGASDRIAFGFTKLLRWTAEPSSPIGRPPRRLLETVAAVPEWSAPHNT